jgi:hypothetical protein
MKLLRGLLRVVVNWRAAAGLILLDDGLVENIRRRIHQRAETMDLNRLHRREAEHKLERAACQEIVEAFTAFNPTGHYRVKDNWPRAWAQISDSGTCLITPWLGLDYTDRGDGIAPVEVTVNWKRDETAAPGQGKRQIPATASKASAAMEMLNSRKGKR